MSELLLYSYRRCPFAIRVRMVLEEKAIPYTVNEENLAELSAELLALHPEGRVPLLVIAGAGGQERKVLYQSTVITEYLDEAYGGPKLMPADPWMRAQVRLWTYWCDNLFKPDLDMYKYELSSMTAEHRAGLVARLEGYLAEWNKALAGREFLLGDTLTLADIHLFPFARQFMAIKPVFPGLDRYERIHEWLASLLARPSFERVMQKS